MKIFRFSGKEKRSADNGKARQVWISVPTRFPRHKRSPFDQTVREDLFSSVLVRC